MKMDDNIDLLKLQFTDLSGHSKMVEVTRGGVEAALRDGYGISRFALEGFEGEDRRRTETEETGREAARKAGREEEREAGREEEPEEERDQLYLRPDPATLRMFGWEPGPEDVAGVICDVCRRDGTPAWADPRSAFKRILDDARDRGFEIAFDFQCEFYLFHTDDEGRPTTVTHEVAGYYDAGSIDLAESVRCDVMMSLADAGLEVESAHHGRTPGQHGFVLPARSGVEAADYLGVFRTAVKRIAKRHGLHATFMPKPVTGGDGSGLRVGITLRPAGEGGGKGKEGAREEREEMLRRFRAGILRHFRETVLFTNPLVNSYKRPIGAGSAPAGSEAEFRERRNDRIARVARGKNGELRLEVFYPDPSANPYLALAALTAAGLDGMKAGREQEEPEETLTFPGNLGVVIREFENSQFARDTFGDRLCDRYLESRRAEWERFAAAVTDWEIKEYLYRC